MVTITMLVGFSLLLVVFLSLIMPMYSYALTLDKPVDCILGSECYIQNYVDLDPSASATDYTCGSLSYDGHKGTDFRLKNLTQMREGVDVLAVADGTVKGIRNGMDDVSFRNLPASAIKDRECGNGVLLFHKGGYQTQYCHLMKDSIAVAEGAQVTRGTVLGRIGQSGMSEFPHLHLEVRNKDGDIIDPFAGAVKNSSCSNMSERKTLWRADIAAQMSYVPTGILGYGFAQTPPSADGVRDGKFNETDIPPTAKTLVFWVDAFGLQNGDVIDNELVDPDNVVVVNQSQSIEGNKAQYFHFIGRHLRGDVWKSGTYRARYRILRQVDGTPQAVIEQSAELTIAPSEISDVSKEDFLKALGESEGEPSDSH